jgi:phosphate-selective porin OprO/OprP
MVAALFLLASPRPGHAQEQLPSPLPAPFSEQPAATHDDNAELRALAARLAAVEASLRGEAAQAARHPSEPSAPHTAGGGSKATGGDPTEHFKPQTSGSITTGKASLKSAYDHDHGGLHWSTPDDEFSFGVSAFTQIDAKFYPDDSPGFATSGLYNPRTRFYLQGHLTKPIQYAFSFQNTYDSLGLTDAYANFNYDERFQVRLGRFKTPFTYEFYRVHVWDLLAPERSLFANNYEANRRLGAMLWGVMADKRIEYAVGTFNTQRNSFQSFDNNQDVMAFLNLKPFYNFDEDFLLRDLHIGGSVDAGQENQPVLPAALRTNSPPGGTAVGGAASDEATLPFLAFNPGVREKGDRALWEFHTALYRGGLSLLAALEGGHESYALSAADPGIRIPINGWFVQGGYILTGEKIRDRTLIEPHHPFGMHNGTFGLGALEVTARYSELELDSRVFTAGLADPARWSNAADLVDVGLNWYLNKYVKVLFDWEHSTFDRPVFSSSSGPQTSNDMFWMRTQLYF